MASDPEFFAYVLDQLSGVPALGHRRMFGEYALYQAGKVVGFVCDNQLYLKPTSAGRALLGQPVEGFPYPGAKPHYVLSDLLDEREKLAAVLLATADELPLPPPRRARSAAARPRKR